MAAFEVVALRAFADNYIWTIRDDHCAAVVDPGEAQPVIDYLERENLTLVAILNTHHHADHVGGNAALLARSPVPVFGPRDERIPEVSVRLADGQHFRLPHFDIDMETLEIPAHTRSHIAFVGGGMLFCGDTLFAAGCGRLFEGTPAQMLASLDQLAALPDNTRICCTHEYTLSNLKFALAVDPANADLALYNAHAQALRAQDLPTLPSNLLLERQINPFLRSREPALIASARAFDASAQDEVSVFAALRQWKNQF